jgi:hypothetical protein
VREDRVGLEDHGDAALLGLEVVHHPPVDLERAGGDVLEPRDHPQERRLPAARRADEDDELAVGDVDVDALDDSTAP